MAMEYRQAECAFVQAEGLALAQNDFDALSRLYMPLQESRRQRRQRCGEGIIRLNLIAQNAAEIISPEKIADQFPQGQLLIAGWGTIQPATELRRLQEERGQYAETFLAAVYPIESARVIAVVPTDEVALPAAEPMSIDRLLRRLPPHSVVFTEDQLPRPQYSEVMALWERLHAPYLAAADQEVDPMRKKIDAYRKTIRVDYACELAHQHLSDLARRICNHSVTHPDS